MLSSDDLTKDSINKIFSIADRLASGKEVESIKEHATVALLFEEPSTRTRISFEVAVAQLGGTAIYVDAHTSQLVRGESLADTAKVISSYCDFIAVRINDHEKLVEIADNSTVPVINALTLLEHPTQALADVYTIRHHIRDVSKARIAFVGDISQNTANSLMLVASKLGAEVNLVGPKGYQPNNRCYTKANSHSKVHLIHSIEDGLDDVDVIYTDTFVSMGRESTAEKRRKLFAPYQVNTKMLKFAKHSAIVMHPLPAHRGEEITADVIDGKHSVVWEQVRNKLLLEKALLVYLSNGR